VLAARDEHRLGLPALQQGGAGARQSLRIEDLDARRLAGFLAIGRHQAGPPVVRVVDLLRVDDEGKAALRAQRGEGRQQRRRDQALAVVGQHHHVGARQVGEQEAARPRRGAAVLLRGILAIEAHHLLLMRDDARLARRRRAAALHHAGDVGAEAAQVVDQ
jgi:hypothetical protein